jgi:hypothetical protein
MKVLLRNPQNVPLRVNENTEAILLSDGKRQTASASFPSGVIPPLGQLQGEIRISGHDLNPSGDVWLPTLVPGKGVNQNIHLSLKRRISVIPGPCLNH